MIATVRPCEDPELSVVMVSHGAWDLTSRAVSALATHTQRPFELIVVDNASDEQTRAGFSQLGNVRVLFNEHNRGFGPANNQGSAEARAEYLLLLNTDVFVGPGWLEPLIEAVGRPGVAAAIPRYVYPNGSLQEAGGLIGRDGSVMLYGEGDDPELPWYRFPRRVDYGSAACMLVRRAEFERHRGFDDRYAPAYFEDADLCLRFAQAGLSVVYEPRSTVTHLRHGSGELSDAAELSARNHRLFHERWEARLAGRPWTLVNATEQAAIAARDALATPRVLICAGRGAAEAEELVDALLEGWPRGRITWVTGGNGRDPDADAWLARGVELVDRRDTSWLGARLFHYDVVLEGLGADADVLGTLARTQPQAPRIALNGAGASPPSLVRMLAGLGIAPQARRS